MITILTNSGKFYIKNTLFSITFFLKNYREWGLLSSSFKIASTSNNLYT